MATLKPKNIDNLNYELDPFDFDIRGEVRRLRRGSKQERSDKRNLRMVLALGASVLALVGGVKLHESVTNPGYSTEKVEITGSGTNSIWAAVDKAVEGHPHGAHYVADEADRIKEEMGTSTVHPGDVIEVHVPEG